MQFSARGYSDEFRRIVAEIKKIFADNVKNNEAFNFLKVEANGTKMEVLLVERSRFSMIQAVRSVRLLHHMPQLNS